MTARRARLARGAVVAFLAALLGGCSAVSTGGPRIVVDRFGDGISDPVAVSVTGLRPGENVELSAEATTARGVWASHAVYAVPPDGRIQLWNQQPLSAPYLRPDGGALLWSMTGPSLSQTQLEQAWALESVRIRLTAQQQGRMVATLSIHRSALAAQSVMREIFSADLVRPGEKAPSGALGRVREGAVYSPLPVLVHRRPAVIVIDGDNGAASGAFVARRIVALGYLVFVLPAFGPEGQIPGSAALSVDSFDAAREWLADRPGVDPQRIVVFGTGNAAPLALWFASNEPGEVYGAIAASGPTALLCASADGAPVLSSGDRPVACERPDRTVAETQILPLGRIPGPVLLACGTADDVLRTACEWMRAGAETRGARGADETLAAPGAAHDLAVPPLLPIGLASLPPATAQATEDARAIFWSRVTSTLERAVRP